MSHYHSAGDRDASGEPFRNPPTAVGEYGTDAFPIREIGRGLEDIRRVAAAILRTNRAEDIRVEISGHRPAVVVNFPEGSLAKNILVTLCDAEADADPTTLSRLRAVFRVDMLRFFAAVPVVVGKEEAVCLGSLLVGDARVARRLDAIQENALIALGRQIGTLVGLEQRKRRLEEESVRLSVLAATDALTGLANRRAFGDRMAATITHARQTATPISLILLDVDWFKPYNDTFGHPAGDEVLRHLARILSRATRDSDITARYGGEEFAVLLPETDGQTAAIIADLLRAEIASSPFPHRGVTASFGVAELAPPMSVPGELIAAADGALYLSKAGGRNRVTLSITDGR